MRNARYALGVALLVAASAFLLPALHADDHPVADSPEVTSLLTQAKDHAARLAHDAEEMQTFTSGFRGMLPQSHAMKINTIREHINNLGKVLRQLSDRSGSASTWQKTAIDRVTPFAQELASNIENTIDHINNNKNRLHTSEYKAYLKANYELSAGLSGLISDFVQYGKNKAAYERLGSKLEAPGH